jgi:beta-galactosidase
MTSFDQIDLPNLTVTEPNPSHALDFRRFSSDQVARFNAGQVASDPRALGRADLAQLHGPGDEFDHFAVGAEMEIATWDSYPSGFLEDRLEDPPSTSAATRGRATRISRPSTTTSTAPWAAAAGG